MVDISKYGLTHLPGLYLPGTMKEHL